MFDRACPGKFVCFHASLCITTHMHASRAFRACTSGFIFFRLIPHIRIASLHTAKHQFKPDVVLANWAIVHRLWHHTFEEFEAFLGQLARQLDGMAKEDAHIPRSEIDFAWKSLVGNLVIKA